MNTLSIISLCISILTLSLTFLRDALNYKREKSNAIINYLNEGDSTEMKELRKILYMNSYELKKSEIQELIKNCYGNKNKETNDKTYYDLEIIITKIISFYDKWALLYNKKYLPKWALEGPRKTTFLEICDIVMFYIEFRRTNLESKNYANDMLKLYKKMKEIKN